MAKFNNRTRKNDEDTIKEEVVLNKIKEEVETNIIENTDPVDPIVETKQEEEKEIQPEEPKIIPVVDKKVTKEVKSSSLAEFLY